MKIAITGASGFIGQRLTNYFKRNKYRVVALERALFDGNHTKNIVQLITGCDVVINLAGANINHRWTEPYKQEIIDSRVNTTRQLVEAINSLQVKPRVFISTSAVGYYALGYKYDEFNEKKGESFLSDVCEAWEQEAKKVSHDVRCVITRLGVVFARDGGIFPQIIRTVKYGFALNAGDGSQYISWIDIGDLLRAYDFVINNSDVWGVVNFTTVTPVTFKDFIKAVAAHYNNSLIINIPKFMIKAAKGEAATMVLDGQKVYPTKLSNAGFKFESKNISQFLNNIFV